MVGVSLVGAPSEPSVTWSAAAPVPAASRPSLWVVLEWCRDAGPVELGDLEVSNGLSIKCHFRH